MKKSHFTYPSKDNRTQIHAIAWEPDGDPVGILQISHGMVEYIDRYDDFATWLAGHGYYVVGNDHLGHGESVEADEKHGYFADENGNECVIGDIQTLRKMTQEKFPDVPYFMLGHSMGSFLLRQYIETYGKGLAGAIIMGTGTQSDAALRMGMRMCKRSANRHGWDYRNARIDRRVLGSCNKQFEPARTQSDWLTKDEAIVDSYDGDPWCAFMFTVNGYYNMFRGLREAQDPERIAQIPKDLPLFLVSGADDPVGNNGKGVTEAYESYRNAGMTDVSIKLYEGDRHEILNELDRDQVYADLLAWMEARREGEKA